MLKIRSLPDDLQKIAIDELGEDPKRLPEDVEALRAWIKQQPHLKVRNDDQFLVQFLRGCKYSLENVKQKFDYYYTVRKYKPMLNPVYDVDDPDFRKLHNTG